MTQFTFTRAAMTSLAIAFVLALNVAAAPQLHEMQPDAVVGDEVLHSVTATEIGPRGILTVRPLDISYQLVERPKTTKMDLGDGRETGAMLTIRRTDLNTGDQSIAIYRVGLTSRLCVDAVVHDSAVADLPLSDRIASPLDGPYLLPNSTTFLPPMITAGGAERRRQCDDSFTGRFYSKHRRAPRCILRGRCVCSGTHLCRQRERRAHFDAGVHARHSNRAGRQRTDHIF